MLTNGPDLAKQTKCELWFGFGDGNSVTMPYPFASARPRTHISRRSVHSDVAHRQLRNSVARTHTLLLGTTVSCRELWLAVFRLQSAMDGWTTGM